MNGLPENFDASFFQGIALEMICFNVNQVYLHFNNKITLVIEAVFSYEDGASVVAKTITVPVETSNLMQLLEHKVVKAVGNKNGDLSLTFDNGHVFTCFDSSPQYESYRIERGDQTIIV